MRIKSIFELTYAKKLQNVKILQLNQTGQYLLQSVPKESLTMDHIYRSDAMCSAIMSRNDISYDSLKLKCDIIVWCLGLYLEKKYPTEKNHMIMKLIDHPPQTKFV